MLLHAQQHDKVTASIANNASNKQWNSCATSAVLFNVYIIFFSLYLLLWYISQLSASVISFLCPFFRENKYDLL